MAMHDLPRNSHRNFIESLGGTNAKVMLMSRYIGFIQSLQKSSRRAVLYLFQRCRNNVMTVTGRNINYIENEVEDSSILTINIQKFKKNYKFSETKDEDAWKVCFVKEIVIVKQNILWPRWRTVYWRRTGWTTWPPCYQLMTV